MKLTRIAPQPSSLSSRTASSAHARSRTARFLRSRGQRSSSVSLCRTPSTAACTVSSPTSKAPCEHLSQRTVSWLGRVGLIRPSSTFMERMSNHICHSSHAFSEIVRPERKARRKITITSLCFSGTRAFPIWQKSSCALSAAAMPTERRR